MPPSGRQTTSATVYGVTYLGIDPGLSGGLAMINPLSSDRERFVEAIPMPETERDVWEWFRTRSSSVQFAAIEQVNGYIGTGQPGSAMFKFGQSYGGLRMALVAARVSFDQVTPQRWQKAFGMRRDKDEPKTKWKNRLKAKAQQLFPEIKVTLDTADAILLAEYARRLKTGELQ